MLNSPRKKLFVAVLLILELVLLGLVITLKREEARIDGLAAPLVGEDTVKQVHFKPTFTSSFNTLNSLGVTVISTGKFFQVDLKSADTREMLAKADVLETVTRGVDSKGKKLNFAVQIRVSDQEINLIPWIVEKAYELKSLPKPGNSILDVEALQLLFPEGSKWLLIPFLDPSLEEITEGIPQYTNYAGRYYGSSSAILQKVFLEGLEPSWGKTILLLDVFYYFEN